MTHQSDDASSSPHLGAVPGNIQSTYGAKRQHIDGATQQSHLEDQESKLRYYLDENGKRIYTLEATVKVDGQEDAATFSAHPARFSPDDKYSDDRIKFKKRFGVVKIQSSYGPDSVAPASPAVHERKDVAPATPAELQSSEDVAAWEQQFRGAAQPGEAANAEPTAEPSAAKRKRRRGTKEKKTRPA